MTIALIHDAFHIMLYKKEYLNHSYNEEITRNILDIDIHRSVSEKLRLHISNHKSFLARRIDNDKGWYTYQL